MGRIQYLMTVVCFSALLMSCEKHETPDTPWKTKDAVMPSEYVDGQTGENAVVSISSAEELVWLAAAVNGSYTGNGVTDPKFENYTFKLTANIDLKGRLWTPIGGDYVGFAGVFDGQGYRISNLNVSVGDEGFAGLFGYNEGTIKDLHLASGLVKATFSGDHVFSAPTGMSRAVTLGGGGGPFAGGLCSYNRGTISGCSNGANVTADYFLFVGGVCGHSDGIIIACHNKGAVKGLMYVGGICGMSEHEIIACYNAGMVTGEWKVGGVCGWNDYGTITACYNKGVIRGEYFIGGVCGYNDAGTLTACYSVGSAIGVITGNVGGVCGDNDEGTVTSCFWTGRTYGYIDEETEITEIRKFASGVWPEAGSDVGQSIEWGTGDGTDSGKYWKSIGAWKAGDKSVYPKLWFE